MSILEIKDLKCHYDSKEIIHQFDLTLNPKEVCAIIGENGGGKSTVLNAILGNVSYSGKIILNNKLISTYSNSDKAKQISAIYQSNGITTDITVLDVVLMGFNPVLKLLESPTIDMKHEAFKLLESLKLSDRASESYQNLSIGQKQMVLLARALINQPSLFVLDEPESALDFEKRYEMIDTIIQYCQSNNCSTIMAIHDGQLALNKTDKIVLLNQGNIVDIIYPKSDSHEKMENSLKLIYGKIELHQIMDKKGQYQWVLLKG